MNRSRRRWSGWSGILGAVLVGCVTNPTPHPAGDATGDTARNDDMTDNTPTDESGCDDIGGFWDGTSCFAAGKPDVETNAPEGDAEVTDGTDAPDTPDGDDTEVDGDPGPSDDTGR